MRKLTVKRNSTFVASLMKVTVCIDDPSSTYTVGGVPCRVLGTLKNGEEKTFAVADVARVRLHFEF